MRARGLLTLTLAAAVGLSACTTPTDRACEFAQSVRLGATQYEVQTQHGRPWRWSEEAEGTLWRYGFGKPGWVPWAEFGLFLTIVGIPLVFVLEGVWERGRVHVWFDEKGKVMDVYATPPAEHRKLECHEGAEPGKARPFTRR